MFLRAIIRASNLTISNANERGAGAKVPQPHFFLTNTVSNMKNALFSAMLLVALFIGCKEKEDLPLDQFDAQRIEGRWVDMTGTLAPDWHYHFDGGLLTQSYIKAGATITALTYPYAIREDSIFIGGDLTNAPRVWLVDFECDEVVQISQEAAVLGQRFWLKRE